MTHNKNLVWRTLAVLFAVTLLAASCGEDETTAPGGAAAPATTEPTPTADTVDNTQDGDLLDTIIARGELICGVSGAAVAFSETLPDGSQTGFDADYCRAVAAAIFGDADAVVFSQLTAAERFTAVQTGAIDVLMRNTTWTQGRDSEVGMDFGPTTYYDGQQFMARASDGFSNLSQVTDIGGTIVCTNSGTTTEQNIADAAAAAGVDVTLNTFEDFDIVTTNFIDGACDIITTDGSALVGRKANQQPDGEDWVIFPPHPDLQGAPGPDLRPEPVAVRRRGELDRVRHDHRGREGRHLGQRRRYGRQPARR